MITISSDKRAEFAQRDKNQEVVNRGETIMVTGDRIGKLFSVRQTIWGLLQRLEP